MSEDLFANDEELSNAVREALAAISLPAEPEDGQNSERVSDLVVMADTLEHRQGVSHVAFNFLVAEICGALEQGLEAGNAGNRPALGQLQLPRLREQDAAQPD